MSYVIGFFIALFIALTGVGAGTITVPVLVLFLGVPAPVAVGIGLMFSAAVKLILVPAHIARRNVAWRTLGYMLLGGAPGVLLGSLFLRSLIGAGSANLINAILGVNPGGHRELAACLFLPPLAAKCRQSRSQPAALLAHVSCRCGGWIFFRGSRRLGQRRAAQPHSAGAGAGDRHRHRFRISRLADWQRRALVLARHKPRAAAAAHRRRCFGRYRRNFDQHPRPAPAAPLCALGLAADPGRPVPLQ